MGENILRYEMVDTTAIPFLLSRTRHCKNHQEDNKQSKQFKTYQGTQDIHYKEMVKIGLVRITRIGIL